MLTERPIKALVLVGGPHHDKPGARDALREALTAPGAVQVSLSDDLAVLASPQLDRYDVLVNYTTGATLTPDQERGLLDFVARGKGFVGIHCASVTFGESGVYRELLGSRFVKHPAFGEVQVSIEDDAHPITQGMRPFTVPDELYILECDPSRFHLLARARAGDVDQPSTYVKAWERGRVFYTSLGHDARCFASEQFRALVNRGIRWTAGYL